MIEAHETVPTDVRCACGKLVARVLGDVLELKCTRCKRVIVRLDGKWFVREGTGILRGCEDPFCPCGPRGPR